MSDFNYQAYLKNNPLLQEEVKEEKLLTESQEIEEIVEETVEEVAEETTEEIQEEAPSSKIKVSELKAKIKEDILSLLQEDEEEDIEVDVEDEVEVDVEEPALDADEAQEGLSADEKEIQDSLKIAYDNAVAIGDKKLADQIGNSITFFTRSHVVER
jgi:cytoskeletal protein RodZ